MDDFYSDGLFDCVVLDRTKYRGKGRPRKTDYISLTEAQLLIIKWNRQFLERAMDFYDRSISSNTK